MLQVFHKKQGVTKIFLLTRLKYKGYKVRQTHKIDIACWVLIVLSALYFLPIIFDILSK